MSWVKYAKGAQKHPAARHVKRELTKLSKKHNDPFESIYFYIRLTGCEREDKNTLRFYERTMYQKLVKLIQDDLKINDESYEGFYTTTHLYYLEFIQAIQKLDHYIVNEYCLHEKYPEDQPKFKPVIATP